MRKSFILILLAFLLLIIQTTPIAWATNVTSANKNNTNYNITMKQDYDEERFSRLMKELA